MSEARRVVVALAPIVDLRRELGSLSCDIYGIGPDRAIYVAADLAATPLLSHRPPYAYRVLAYVDGTCRLDLTITGLPFPVHHVQPLGEHLLLASARQRSGVVDCNARVYTRDGQLVRELALGDGIEDIQTTKAGEIWTSYFDQGVFGGDPVAAKGLVAWNEDGEPVYTYGAPAGVGGIVDCYALNVAAKDDVWLYYYTEFPLVRIRHRRVAAVWNPPVQYSKAFAVDGRHALFRGGHGNTDDYLLYALGDDGDIAHLSTYTLCDEDGEPIDAGRVLARADVMTIESRGRIYALRIDDALARITR